MARIQGDTIEPFTVGESLGNGWVSIYNYNTLIVILRETKVNNATFACVYNRDMGRQHYGFCSHTGSGSGLVNWWHWFTIDLSNYTFQVDGSYTAASLGGAVCGTHYNSGEIQLAGIYGMC